MYQKHSFEDFYIAIKSFMDVNSANESTEFQIIVDFLKASSVEV